MPTAAGSPEEHSCGLFCREMSKDGEFLASSGAGFGPSPTTAILETQVGVPTSSESAVNPSVVQDRVPPRGPGTTVDTDSALLRGNQGSLAPSFPVSVSADSATSTPGGSRRHSGSAARGPDRHSSTASVRLLEDVLSQRWSDLECLDELARHESDSSRAGRKRSASPSGRSSRRDIRAHVGATPAGMIRGELTGALYEIPVPRIVSLVRPLLRLLVVIIVRMLIPCTRRISLGRHLVPPL